MLKMLLIVLFFPLVIFYYVFKVIILAILGILKFLGIADIAWKL